MSESKRGWMPQLKQRANAPFYSLLFWSALNRGLDDGHPHWRDLTQSANQMLKSSRNTLIDTSGKSDLPTISVSLGPVKLTYRVNHHNVVLEYSQDTSENFKLFQN